MVVPYTDRAIKLIDSARGQEAVSGVLKVLGAIIGARDGGLARFILEQNNLQTLNTYDVLSGKTYDVTVNLESVVQRAALEAQELGHNFVGSEHLLLACLKLMPDAVPLDYSTARITLQGLLNLPASIDNTTGKGPTLTEFKQLDIKQGKKVVTVGFKKIDLIDAGDIQTVGAELWAAAEFAAEANCRLVVSFRGVRAISSAFVGRLVVFNRKARTLGVPLSFCHIPPEVTHTLNSMMKR